MKIFKKEKLNIKYKDLNDYLINNPVLEYKENDYHLLPDLNKAVNYLCDKKESKIVIYGDYDSDGINASMIMYKGLKSLGYKNINISIPERSEGYGTNINRINKIIEENNEIVITVDNGISSIEDIEVLNKHNITTIITDHHEPKEVLPNAYCVIDPKRKDSEYPFKDICGAVVAYKLIKGLNEYFNSEIDKKLLCYCAIATLSDTMPILDENKYYVSKGLEIINSNSILIRSILTAMNMNNKINELNEEDLLFYVAPFINSSSRVASVKDCLCMYFFDDNFNTCLKYATTINKHNNLRKNLSKELYDEVNVKIKKDYPFINNTKEPIIIAGDNYHQGIIGIVAGRINNEFNVPCVILTKEDNKYHGSCRSIEEINLLDLFDTSLDLFEKFGGHKQAAGLSLPIDNLYEFKHRVHEYSLKNYPQSIFEKTIDVTCKLNLNEATIDTIDSINDRRPFGHLNEEPLFYGEYKINNIIKLGKDDKHLKLIVEDNSANNKEILLFNYNKNYDFKDKINLTFRLNINEFRGNKTIQLIAEDLVE